MLEGPKVKLRKVQENDLEVLYSSLEEIIFSGQGFVHEIQSANLFLESFLKSGFFSDQKGLLVIVDYKERILGAIFFDKVQIYDGYNLKFVIFDEKNHSQGLMGEALELFTHFFFNYKNISRLQMLIPDYHRPAIKVAQKCGYKLEGVLKAALFFQGKFIDLCVYAKLKQEMEQIAEHETVKSL